MKTKYAERFVQLVKINSPSGHEDKMIELLSTWLLGLNFKISVDKVKNLYGYREGKGEPILLCAHMDTVQPGEGVEPIIDGEIVKSNGKTILGADNKAAITGIMFGVEEYLNTEEDARPIEIIFAAKEETGGGVEVFDFSQIKSKFGIIFDLAQPVGTIAIASPYIFNFYVNFNGKAAHSSRPNEGKSALVPAIKLLSSIPVGLIDNNDTTINVGKVAGGTGINTVMAEFKIAGEVRSFNESLFNDHLAEIKKIAQKFALEADVEYSFSTNGYCAGYNFSEDDKLIIQISEILKNAEHEITYYKTRGISDSNPLVEAGIKVVTLGDGVSDPHTVKEQIHIQSLEYISILVEKFLNSLTG